MDTSGDSGHAWNEADSQHFVEFGRVYTPARDEIRATVVDLMPVERNEPFLVVDVGLGSGWLSAAILDWFPEARVLGLDGSATMLQEAATRLARFPGRFELRQFRLEETAWRMDFSADVRCFVSSLAIHHLDSAGKQALYGDLHACLADGGALLIADLVAPRSEWERRYNARQWDVEVEKQSIALTGSLHAYRQFIDSHWNYYRYPDSANMPSTIGEHLQWLAQAGFEGANVFWERVGHAVYGGYKAASKSV